MEDPPDLPLHRTSSQLSTSSNLSRRSSRRRVGQLKNSRTTPSLNSAQSTPTTSQTDKSLTSFPSLSPENSPNAVHHEIPKKPVDSQVAGTTKRGGRAASTKASIVSSLVANSPSFRGRAALFEESSATSSEQQVPGALHHASDEVIRRLAAKTGVVKLIRQLASDVAQRDAEITTFRRRAEERERELKKMLREVEVSNLSIETRLHHLDTQQDADKTGDSMRRRAGSVSAPQDTSRGNTLLDMMGQAMNEEVGTATDDEDHIEDQASLNHRDLVEGGTARHAKNGDSKSIASSVDSYDVADTIRGWKDYLWDKKRSREPSIVTNDGDKDYVTQKANRSRVTSSGAAKRKGLNNNLFQPPARTGTMNGGDNDAITSEDNVGAGKSRSASASVSSWTMKLFAGNPQAPREPGAHDTIRGRSATNASDTTRPNRNASKASSVQTASSARAALMRVSSRTGNQLPRKPVQPLPLGPNGTVKGSAAQSVHSLMPGSPTSMDEASQNLGPVEMDTILPFGSRPPTLVQSNQNLDSSADFLTDRFGFIYDQRRRKKEAESMAVTLSSSPRVNSEASLAGILQNIDSANKPSFQVNQSSDSVSRPDTPSSTEEHQPKERPAKRWQDYLKVAKFPTELLSNTPSPSQIMSVSNPDIKKSLKRTPTFSDMKDGKPSISPNPKPAATSITADNAEMAKPDYKSANPALTIGGDTEPVKLLLAQLTELHDNLQKEKTIRWNEFMRKVRAERRKAMESTTANDRQGQAKMPETSLADGEMIGIATIGRKGKIGRAKYKEFKSLVLAGIPVVHRAKVWAEGSGALTLRIPGYYDELINNGIDDEVILAQIQMDINRTLTDNVFFRKGPGVAKLKEVLLVYARRNPEVGYCQGMNLITASLLLIMPTAEDAFWLLASIVENILPRHYYDNSLLTSRADQQVLRQYVTEVLPKLSSHLDELSIELEALTFQWFLSIFTDCLSAEALYRVWDVLFCCKDEDGNGGSTFLFQVALALLKLNELQLIACETPGEVYAYLGGEITNHAISIDGLIRASEGLKGVVRRADVEERREKYVQLELETVKEREKIRSMKPVRAKQADKENVEISPSIEAQDSDEEGLQGISPMPVSD
ncbi:hypothetical protein MMC25_005584 [Agyrium rufum]|nr:hypothetical protein [Agyrium rufum]